MDTEERQEELLTAMRRPSFYPHPVAGVELRETAISWLFLAGERVYKVKKPVVLPFLDYGTLERRRWLCEEEVRLNRRLAPETYLGVRPIRHQDDRLILGAAGEEQDAEEFAVEMRRLPEDRTLASMFTRDALAPTDMRRVAERLARFHEQAEPVPADSAGVAPVAAMVANNFETLLSLLPAGLIDGRRFAAAQRFASAFVTARSEQLAKRAVRGRFREGHGDLRLEHVVLDDSVQVFDCIEFDPDLRRIDVGADLAFLVMDLHAAGARTLADVLTSGYRDAGGDPGDDALLSFYCAYRALVRAKLRYMEAAELPEDDPMRRAAVDRAEALFSLAERFAWRARLPLVLVVCGVTASGKTTVARELCERSGLPYFGSDVTRKRLAGVAAAGPAPPGAYSEAFNRRTYAELGRLGREAGKREGGAIVDATFRHASDREAFRKAFGAANGGTVYLECLAPTHVLLDRATQRAPGSPSDATLELVEPQLREFTPLDEIPAEDLVQLRTDSPVGECIEDLLALLDSRLADPERSLQS
jgi:aminoglycoside phosphotransferase family enzyme/predicted kinase